MGFADPLGLLFSASIGVLVFLYLWERRRRAVTVPALFLWQSLREDTLRAQRFRPDILFLLQLLALAALVAGLAKPYLKSDVGKPSAGRHILVVDTSASMQAMEPEGTRWSMARARALQSIDSMPRNAEIMLIAAADTPEVVVPFTRDRGDVQRALLQLEPVDTGGDLAVALAYANSARSRSDAATEVTVYTDIPATELPVAVRGQVRVEQVGSSDDNVGIEALQIFQGRFQDPTSASLEVRVRNFSHSVRHGSLSVDLEGGSLLRTGFTLAAQEAQTFNVRGLPGPGRVVAHLGAEDSFALDDTAYGWVRPVLPLRVLVVASDDRWLQSLRELAAVTPGLELIGATPETAWPAEPIDVVIYYQTSPSTAPPANALYIYPPRDNRWFPVTGEATQIDILDWNSRHALLRTLRPVSTEQLEKARIITPPAGSQGLLWSRLGDREFPLAFALDENGRRTVCFSFDLAAEHLLSSDNLGMFLFFLNSLAWLAPDQNDAAVVRTGETYSLPNALSVEIRDPRGDVRTMQTQPATVTPRYAGAYRLRSEGQERMLLVNFADARESAIGRSGSAAPAAPLVEAVALANPLSRPPDFGADILAFALAMLLAEWLVAGRRRA